MTPGFKKLFTCFRREISDVVIVNKKENNSKTKVKQKSNKNQKKIVNSIKNDLTSEQKKDLTLKHKNSNAYRDYSHNCESLTLSHRHLKSTINSNKIIRNDSIENGGVSDLNESDSIDNTFNNSRVHSAMVSKVNINSRSVTVEWYERGETKGKEVELDAILQLNTELQQQETVTAPVPKKQATAAANLSRESSQSSLIEDDAFLEDGDNGILVSDMVGSTLSGGTLPIRATMTSSTRSNPTQSAIRVTKLQNNNVSATNGNRTARTGQTISSNQSTNSHNGQGDHIENIPPSSVPKTRATVVQQQQQQQNIRMSTANNMTANAGSRRSYVVKEVERLKENREKRRARQAELKEEKTALMNSDPGNPNWELSAMIREYQNLIDFRPLVDGQPVEDHQITVCVRKRPLSKKEIQRKEIDVISVPSKDQLIVHEPKSKVDLTKFLENHKFRYDYALDDTCNNELVYRYTAKPLVKTIFEGGMATCFAYGQTGSGKTHTMGGEFNGKIQDCKNGIYAMVAKDVFSYLNSAKYNNLKLVVSASFFEIYSGKVFDLLADKQKLRVLEDGKQQVQVVGLTEKVVDSVDEVLKLIQHGNSARTSGQTSANSNSSRSHAVFQVVLRPAGTTRIHGKFSLIDLAGNERGADTSSANRQTRMEGAEINKSLLALKECIRALGKQNAHLPFRVSKLTQVLRDSFIGEKSKTCMIAMISPGLSSCEHTLNTLRYANRVKELVVTDPEARIDDELMEEDEQKNGQANENGMAQLRSFSEQDMSVDLYNQHAAISELQQTEEELVDQHRAMNEFLAQFLPESRELYNTTNYVDYDQDAYCKRGEELFTQLAALSTACKDLMAEFRGKLAREEMLSHKMNPGKR